MAKKESSCALCGSQARMFCESDQARLCWDCDESVHAANFLVAKHTRTALCNLCHCQTPWKASGPKLGRTISVCGVCVARSGRAGAGSAENEAAMAEEETEPSRNVRIAAERGGGGYTQRDELDDDEYDDDSEDYDDSGDEDEYSGGCDEDDDDDDDENQVVPWTSSPLPPSTSTSSSEEESFSAHSASRIQDTTSLTQPNGEIGWGAASNSLSMAVRSRPVAAEEEVVLRGGLLRPWKYRRVAAQP